jgi:hypothetical protein
MHRIARLAVIALLVGAALAPQWATGSPASASTRSPASASTLSPAVAPSGPLAELWTWLANLWPRAGGAASRPQTGCGPDPLGGSPCALAPARPASAPRPQTGCGPDPGGGPPCALAPARLAAPRAGR